MMRLLHTSDWHIGHTLFGRKRYEVHEQFLEWLLECLKTERIDVLLVAGDIFDTIAPTNRAQAMYYGFLHRVAATGCRHIVISGGNHDSPSLLDAPKALLAALQIHVIGAAAETAAEEVLLLRDARGAPELIICAVPFLRERDMRLAEAGETAEEKDLKLQEGIRRHYGEVAREAERMRDALYAASIQSGDPQQERIPIVGLGHLFAAGGMVTDGDGVRDLYVGSLARFPAVLFPPCFDYLALGHLLAPQTVHGAVPARYSGAPLPMGFGEIGQQKKLFVVELGADAPVIRSVDIPSFQALARVRGDWDEIETRLREVAARMPGAWLEVIYSGSDVLGDLRERLETLAADTGLELLRIRNERLAERVLEPAREGETLDDLDDAAVFVRCLEANGVPDAQWPELQQAYDEIVAAMRAEDRLAQ